MNTRQHFVSRLFLAFAAIAFVIVVTRFRFQSTTPKQSELLASSAAPARTTGELTHAVEPTDSTANLAPNESAFARWQQLLKQSASSLDEAKRNQALCATLEEIATRDPDRALALALTQTDSVLRSDLLQAVLRGWTVADLNAAANWTFNQTYIDHGLALAAVFNGANRAPENAVALAQRLSSQQPENAGSYGNYLIFGLAQVGEFERAAAYAANSAPNFQTDLLCAAYGYWAKQQPERAVYAALKLDDPAKQDAAFQAAVSGWARANPQALALAASQFPEGADRTLALTTGVRSWLEKDPAAAADWISKNKLSAKEADLILEE